MAKIYTDLEIRKFSLKKGEGRKRLPVGESVYVVVEPVKEKTNYMGKSFIGRCNFPRGRKGKQVDVRLGLYGIGRRRISIKEAKDKFRQVMEQSNETGVDPREIIKKEKNRLVITDNEHTCLEAVNGWFRQNEEEWSKTTVPDYKRRVFNQIFNPEVGGFDINNSLKVFAWENNGRDKVLTWFDREKKRTKTNATRNLMVLRGILEWSIDRGWLNLPNAAMSSKNTRVKKTGNHNPHLSWSEIDDFIQEINQIEASGESFLVINALKLAMLTGLRTGSLVQLEFKEIDEKENMLVIPDYKMKRKVVHYVPLTESIWEIIKKLEHLNKDHSYMFFSHRGNRQPFMQEGGINNFIVRLEGGKYFGRQTAHGFRGFMFTHGVDVLGYDERTIDRQLHHSVGTKIERAYNHAKYFKQRREFMKDWCDALVEKGI